VCGLRAKGDLVSALQSGWGRTSRNNKQMAFPSKMNHNHPFMKEKSSRGSLQRVGLRTFLQGDDVLGIEVPHLALALCV
jgi:hypothetical protein